MADQTKTIEGNIAHDKAAEVGGAGAPTAAQAAATTATDQTSEAPAKEFGDMVLTYFNRRLRAHPHPTVKTGLREVEVLEVMPDTRLKVAQQGAQDGDYFIVLDDALMDQLVARLGS